MLELGIVGVIALVIGAATAGGLVTTWRLHRRALRLEDRVGTLEEVLISRRNREASQTRWEKKKATDDELIAWQRQHQSTPARHRFDNDPLGADEFHGTIR